MKLTVWMAILFVSLLLGWACAPLVDSPFSDQLRRTERSMNSKALNKIGDIESDGVIRFAVFSDSHQNYKHLDLAVSEINKVQDVDFIAGLGDYTNSGYNLEYDQFIDGLEAFKLPTILALGNHDSIGAGVSLFKKAFGEPNFWFESTTYRFVFFHANNLEDPDGFKPQWLQDVVTASSKPVIIFAHVQLRDSERFFGSDASIFNSVITDSKVKMVLNGHNHVYDYATDNSTVMLQCGRVEIARGQTHWLLVEITGTNLCVKRSDTGSSVCQSFK